MFTSLYPDLPVVPPTNVHNILFRRPELKDQADYTLHIDAVTGKKRSFREFYERVIDGAIALGSPVSEKGLGLNPTDGELIGIMAENCMVRLLSLVTLALLYRCWLGLYYSDALMPCNNYTIHHAILVLHPIWIIPRPPFGQSNKGVRPAKILPNHAKGR